MKSHCQNFAKLIVLVIQSTDSWHGKHLKLNSIMYLIYAHNKMGLRMMGNLVSLFNWLLLINVDPNQN